MTKLVLSTSKTAADALRAVANIIPSETPRQRFARRLRAGMKNQNLTVPMLANRVGVRRPTVYNWIAARRLPEPKHLKKLCTALKMKHSELILD